MYPSLARAPAIRQTANPRKKEFRTTYYLSVVPIRKTPIARTPTLKNTSRDRARRNSDDEMKPRCETSWCETPHPLPHAIL
jgi:hypothetical protein